MSAAAIHLLDHLRENGVDDDRAVKIAEAFDQRVDEAMREAKAHSDRNRVETEEKAKALFVPVADYHARDKTLATREDVSALRAEIAAHRAETRAELRAISHLLLGGFITLFVPIVAGAVAVIAKLFFGG